MSHNIVCKIAHSLETDPWYNLALEEKLLSEVKENEVILYLWQNDNTIVIGRNQNPYKECLYAEFMSQGGKIARRLSGGGTVFHDLGNLNFTFIMDKRLIDIKKQLMVIIDALTSADISAEFSGRNDILVEDKKISGNAFYENENAYFHHGTILVNSDLNKLANYLKVSKNKILSKGIDSVISRVTNLCSINDSLTVDIILRNLEIGFQDIYGKASDKKYYSKENFPICDLYKKYSSWDWIFGETPEFDIKLEGSFPFGELNLLLKINDGIICGSKIYSDAMDSTLIETIGNSLTGLPFVKDSIELKLNSLNYEYSGNNIIPTITKWMCELI